MTIQNARSNTTGRAPAALQDGQIAVNQADGVLFTRNPDGTIKRNLLAKRVGVADAAFMVRIFDTYVGIASLTATRAIILPAASAYPPGTPLTIADEAGACSPTVVATITAVGSDKINGNATYAMAQAYLGIILFSDGVSKWTAIALPGSGASNSVLYVAQSITAAQQDQARLNLNGAAPASPTATTALALLDLERDQYTTGTTTLTMPGASPGWRSGIVTNDNTLSGIVTLAVPAGNFLDGALNGSLKLLPKQRARLRLVSAGVWRSDWVDRTPVVASATITSAVASIDLPLPTGYAAYEFTITDFRVDTNGAVFSARFSSDGGATFRSGASDYYLQEIYSSNASATSVNSGYGAAPQMEIAGALSSASVQQVISRGVITPGLASKSPSLQHTVGYVGSDASIQTRIYTNFFNGGTIAVNAIRFLLSTGNLTSGNFIIRGVTP